MTSLCPSSLSANDRVNAPFWDAVESRFQGIHPALAVTRDCSTLELEFSTADGLTAYCRCENVGDRRGAGCQHVALKFDAISAPNRFNEENGHGMHRNFPVLLLWLHGASSLVILSLKFTCIVQKEKSLFHSFRFHVTSHPHPSFCLLLLHDVVRIQSAWHGIRAYLWKYGFRME